MNQKEWTIMIYMAGDNNLAVDNAYALGQIKEAAKNDAEKLNLFVYYDGNSPEIPTLYCDFSEPEPKYYRSVKVGDKLFEVPPDEVKDNENAADPKSILNFVDWCVNKVGYEDVEGKRKGRRANRYALIFSGHSLGFLDKGLFKDESSDKTMNLNTLSRVFRRLTEPKEVVEAHHCSPNETLKKEWFYDKSDELLGKKLDILGFDSCVMGMLEVGYQFYECAETMIVSEGSIPSAGWTYAKILRSLACGAHAQASAEQVARQFVKEFIKGQGLYTIGGVSVDLAAWDMTRFRALTLAFDKLSTALYKCFEREDNIIYRQMERVVLQVHWKCQSYMYDQNVDLGDFCELLKMECESVAHDLGDNHGIKILKKVQNACEKVLRELKKAVLLSGFSGGAYQYSNGVSVFFPWSWEGYQASQENYQQLHLVGESGYRPDFNLPGGFDDPVNVARRNKLIEAGTEARNWAQFLVRYLRDVARRKFEPLTPDAPLESKYRYRSGITFDEETGSLSLSDGDAPLSKMGSSQSAKMGSSQSAKMGSSQSAKMGSSQSAKMGSSQSAKMGSSQSAKMGGGGVTAFYEKLRLWKNIESEFNISGFTKRPGETESEAADANEATY
jgi:hypothetical protein